MRAGSACVERGVCARVLSGGCVVLGAFAPADEPTNGGDGDSSDDDELDMPTSSANAVAEAQQPMPQHPAAASCADQGLRAASGHGRNYRPSLRLLADLVRDGDTAVVARGGRGGRGNAALGHDTPGSQRDHAERGARGDIVPLLMELKAVADVGLVGAPNAGKSTLLVCCSPAAHRIACSKLSELARTHRQR